MYYFEEEQVYEEKLDEISERLEVLILDAMLSALRKMKDRNVEFDKLAKRSDADVIPF